jgi:hypothetical protein
MNDRERQLEREGAQRRTVTASSIVAGVLLIAGAVFGGLAVESKDPAVGIVQGLTPALRGLTQAAVDPHAAREAFIYHHRVGLIFATLVIGLGTIAMVPVLRYLYAAARARRPQTPTLANIFGTAGPLLAALMGIAAEVALVIKAHDFLSRGDLSHTAVDHAVNAGARVVFGSLATAGQLSLAIAFVMISLNAMRVGLLTRMMGVMGIISGILFVIPVTPLPVVQAFWLIAIGVMLSERGPSPLPPAWHTGEAEPWPSQQQLREQRERERDAGGGGAATATPAPVAPAKPSPSASKKRKRRRH